MNEKNIIRTNKRESEKPFVMIERGIFEDTELSWRAKGLLGYLLSRPDDWSVCVADLINRSTDGRDSCYAALKELGDAGYIAKSARPKLAGRFGGFEYVVFEKPVSVPRDVSPVGKTAYGLPVSGETVSGETDTTYKDYTNNDYTNNKNTAPIVADTAKKTKFDEAQFDQFWAVWPKRKDKETAKKAWAKLKIDQVLLDRILAAVNAQKLTWDDPRYIKNPATWINGKCWEDETINPNQPAFKNDCPSVPPAAQKMAQHGQRADASAIAKLREQLQ